MLQRNRLRGLTFRERRSVSCGAHNLRHELLLTQCVTPIATRPAASRLRHRSSEFARDPSFPQPDRSDERPQGAPLVAAVRLQLDDRRRGPVLGRRDAGNVGPDLNGARSQRKLLFWPSPGPRPVKILRLSARQAKRVQSTRTLSTYPARFAAVQSRRPMKCEGRIAHGEWFPVVKVND